jgi:hypothetical protein
VLTKLGLRLNEPKSRTVEVDRGAAPVPRPYFALSGEAALEPAHSIVAFGARVASHRHGRPCLTVLAPVTRLRLGPGS